MKKLRLALAVALASAAIVAVPAHAESQYRYWSFWQKADAGWALSSVGMMSIPAEQGLVQGWRFVTAGVTAPTELAPRLEPSFETICAGQADAAAGYVNMAIIIDYGDATDYADGVKPPAVRAACVSVEAGSPSSKALAQIADIRENAGFVCGLDALPATGCGDEVQMPTTLSVGEPLADQAATVDDTEQKWDLVATVVTTALGLVVFVMAWRRMMLQKANQRKDKIENE